MSSCYICGTPMDEIKIDPRDLKPRPCSHCEEVISETVSSFEEDSLYTFIDEDEFIVGC